MTSDLRHPSTPTPAPMRALDRRRALFGLLAGAAAVTLAGTARRAWAKPAVQPLVQVWKSPTCGCCKDWITHMEANGFRTEVHTSGNTEARVRLGMPLKYGSCHTALVDGYVLEGHVPAREVHRLLKERPSSVVGLAVPAMPLGSPGMDGPEYGGRRDPYDVLLVTRDGQARPYQSYR